MWSIALNKFIKENEEDTYTTKAYLLIQVTNLISKIFKMLFQLTSSFAIDTFQCPNQCQFIKHLETNLLHSYQKVLEKKAIFIAILENSNKINHYNINNNNN